MNTAHGTFRIPTGTVMAVITGLAVMQSASAQDYAIFALPDTGQNSLGWKVNSFGEVAGDCATYQETFHAARWPYDVGWTLDLLDVESRFYSRAFDINDLGEIVGRASMEGGDDLCTPFVWRNGVTTYLPTLGGVNGWAKGINNEGLIVGLADTPNEQRAAIWDNDQVIDLGGFSEFSARANDINNNNWVVGRSDKYYGHDEPIIWKYADGKVYEIIDLGQGNGGDAFAINDRNESVGWDNYDAFFWDEFGVRYNIHTLGQFDTSWANDINNNTQVVGAVANDYTDVWGFIWTSETGMVLLQDLLPAEPLWNQVESAQGINDLGQIVGQGYHGYGDHHAFIMSPVYPSFDLSEATPGIAGKVNQITVSNIAPGTRVYFCWSTQSGGRLIPGCDATVNALQLEDPEVAGSAVANSYGIATLKGKVPRRYSGDTLLFQAVVPGECAISNLVVQKFE